MAASFQRLLFLVFCLLGKRDFHASKIALPIFRDTRLLGGFTATNPAFRHFHSPPFAF